MHIFKRLAVGLGCLVVLVASASAGEFADRIWSGGPVLTMNDAAMRAEAVAEKGGKIMAVGSAAELMKLKGLCGLFRRHTRPGAGCSELGLCQ